MSSLGLPYIFGYLIFSLLPMGLKVGMALTLPFTILWFGVSDVQVEPPVLAEPVPDFANPPVPAEPVD